MDVGLKDRFLESWGKYFDGAGLPLCFYYTNDESLIASPPGTLSRCVINVLNKVRDGKSLVLDVESVGCPGGKKYLGFKTSIRDDFEFFLSCGIPGSVEGERYKKSTGLVREMLQAETVFTAPGRFVVFKRWDKLEVLDKPAVAVFFAGPDVLAGLFTLANFDEAGPDGVFCPFGSGCSTIIRYPFLESLSPHPRGVIGLFDISARPFLLPNTLSFAVPWSKLMSMLANMDESFLVTPSWSKVRKRIMEGKA